jgi:predicted alpha/beta hydrolase
LITIITASALAAFFVMFTAGPIIGEAIATMSPVFSHKESDAIADLGLKYELVAFSTSDGLTLRGWFFPALDPHAPAILYAPATAHDQRQGLSLVAPLQRAGFQVLLFSFRGHGASDGSRFDFSYGARESQDVDAAVNYLYEQRGIHQIGAIGHSAGAASIIISAARNPHLGAVAAAASFSSIEETWLFNRPQIYPKPLYNLAMRLFELRKRFSRQQVRPLDVIGQIAPRTGASPRSRR